MLSKDVHIYHADAGAGKTYKMLQIISQHVKEGVPLHRIAFVTFTKAAALVAQQRVCEQFGVALKDAPHFRTIHSMCFQRIGATTSRMMDDEKYQDFGTKSGYSFGKLYKPRSLEDVDWKNMTDAQLVSFEQLYRSNRPRAQWLLENKIDNLDFVRYCREYVKYKKTFNYLDFTDLLEDYIDQDLFEDVDVACIDEAQDCSPLQWQVLLKAFRNAKHIYIVGDIKQSIYGFSGSDGSILLKFKGQQHTMDKSYRVPAEINKFVKKHIVDNMTHITPTECLSEHEGGEVKYLVTLSQLKNIDTSKSYLFLARNRKFLYAYKDYLEELCIPYSMMNIPVFSNTEKQQFRDGQTSMWDKAKRELARRYYNAGTFYRNTVVRVDTIHGVKGDEADITVLMPDMSRLTWKEYADDPSQEHNVFYVGCTRARETLYILEPATKFYYEYLF